MEKDPEVIFECYGWVHEVEGDVAKIALRICGEVLYRWANCERLEACGVCYDMAPFKYRIVKDGSGTRSSIEPYEHGSERARPKVDLFVFKRFQHRPDDL